MLETSEKELGEVLDSFLWDARNQHLSTEKDRMYRRYNQLVFALRGIGCSVILNPRTDKHIVTVKSK